MLRREGYNAAMKSMHEPGVEDVATGRGGCLRALVAAPALVVLAPAAALYRSWARWRRGSLMVVKSHIEPFERSEAGWVKISASIDIPHSFAGVILMTRCVVRIAEGMAGGGEVFHLVHREPGRDETIAVPVGSSVNDLAERFALSCGRSILDRSTLVWPALARGHHLGEVIDPVAYDPEAPGEPDAALRAAPITWAMILRRQTGTASTIFDVDFIVPQQHAEKVEAAVNRLSAS